MFWTWLELILASCRCRSWCWGCLCVFYRLMVEEAVIHDKDLHFTAMWRFIWVLCVWTLHVHVPSCYIENEKAFMVRRVCVCVLFRMCSRYAVCVISRVCTADYSLTVCLNLILCIETECFVWQFIKKKKNATFLTKKNDLCGLAQYMYADAFIQIMFFYQFIQPWELNPCP